MTTTIPKDERVEDSERDDLDTSSNNLNEQAQRARPRKSARTKAMDFLSRRGYSEKELLSKLRTHYSLEEAQEAIQFALENGWMTSPDELSERVTLELDRKLKGYLFIRAFLQEKGLKALPQNEDVEFEKGLKLLEMKLPADLPFSFDLKQQAMRILKNRGYTPEIIRRVVQERSK